MAGLSLVDMYGGTNAAVATAQPPTTQAPTVPAPAGSTFGGKSTTAAWVAAVLVLVAIRVLWEVAEEV